MQGASEEDQVVREPSQQLTQNSESPGEKSRNSIVPVLTTHMLTFVSMDVSPPPLTVDVAGLCDAEDVLKQSSSMACPWGQFL